VIELSDSSVLSVLLDLNDMSEKYFKDKGFDQKQYTLENLKNMEKIICDNFSESKTVATNEIIPFGFFLGQLITNTIPNAYWDDVQFLETNTEEMTISIGLSGVSSKLMLFPMKRAARFFANSADSIVSFYEITKMISEKNIDVMEIEPGSTYEKQNIVFKIRSVQENKTSIDVTKNKNEEEEK
jgi:hypothetical protein